MMRLIQEEEMDIAFWLFNEVKNIRSHKQLELIASAALDDSPLCNLSITQLKEIQGVMTVLDFHEWSKAVQKQWRNGQYLLLRIIHIKTARTAPPLFGPKRLCVPLVK
jgi:hypothetical protein